MKKILLTMALFTFFTQLAFSVEIGYVDMNRVVDNYPLAQKYKKELTNKYNSINNYVKKQEESLKKAKTKEEYSKIRQKGLTEVERMQKEYIQLKKVKEDEVLKKIKLSADKVRTDKKLDVILKKDAQVTGGVDVTQDVINGLR